MMVDGSEEGSGTHAGSGTKERKRTEPKRTVFFFDPLVAVFKSLL